jgi:peptidoglycan/xylan/chitin deacetylase (PgdA/CDA1 family)
MTLIPVLMYHHVCGVTRDHPELVVSRETFRKQVEYLAAHGYYTPRVSELLHREHDCLQRSPVLITFDDGYLDMFEVAFPILKDFGFSAVVSRSADFSRTSNWWDPDPDSLYGRLMGCAHLRELDKAGMEIGSHAMHHSHLPLLPVQKLQYELAESKKVLEDLLGKEVIVFTYPYGETNNEIKKMVELVGYQCAFAAYTGPLGFQADLFEIRRIFMKNRSSVAYMAGTLGGLSVMRQWTICKARDILGAMGPRHSGRLQEPEWGH